MSATLKALDEELARLQTKQSNLADPAQEQRKREAARYRQALEESNQRHLAATEPVRKEVEQLEKSVQAMKASKMADTSPQLAQRLRGFEVELGKKLNQLAALVKRAKEQIAASESKIAWCKRVESGLTTDSDERDVEAGLDELATEGGR